MQKQGEDRLIAEITNLADRIRAMRLPGASGETASIKALEAESRAKWDELRALRAGPVNVDEIPRYGRSSRQ